MGKNHLLLQKDFVQYRAAMISGIYGIVNETKEYIDPDCDLKIFLPAIDGAKTDDDGNPLIVIAGDATQNDFMFIAKASEVKEYAKKFLVWLSTKDMASAYIRYTAGGSPYKYDPDKLDGITSLTRSCLEMASKPNFVVVDTTTDDPIVKLGKITMWPQGEPYSSMVLQNKSPSSVIKSQATYVASQWPEWERLAGVKQ